MIFQKFIDFEVLPMKMLYTILFFVFKRLNCDAEEITAFTLVTQNIN